MHLFDIIHLSDTERDRLRAELFRRAVKLYQKKGLWQAVAECWVAAGQPEQAAALYQERKAYARAAPLLLEAGRYDEALACYRQWLTLISEKDVVGQISARLGISTCLKRLRQDLPEARELFRAARALIESDPDRHPLTAGRCWEALGAYGAVLGRTDLIRVGYEQAIVCYGDEHPDDRILAAQAYLDAIAPEVSQQEAEGSEFPSREGPGVGKEGRRQPAPGEIWQEPITGMECVWIPAGTFLMGSPESEEGRYDREGPVHEVSVDGFWLGKYPVTNAQYRTWKAEHDSREWEGHSLNEDDQPVVYVSWEDATAFAAWLNEQHGGQYAFRLPTEAEWEYACRAGSTTRFCFGDAEDSLQDYAWYSGNSGSQTHPVGQLRPNAWGLYDMHGNVYEWCEDIYAQNAYSQHQRLNPIYAGAGSNRVLRGGSWLLHPRYVRCAYRSDRRTPQGRDFAVGFRLARAF